MGSGLSKKNAGGTASNKNTASKGSGNQNGDTCNSGQHNGAKDIQEITDGDSSKVSYTKNTFVMTMTLPYAPQPPQPASVQYTSGSCSSRWPIRSHPRLDFNVNAGPGGCASLILISNAYGGDGADTTAQVFLGRSGVDGNHISFTSISHSHHGHFGASNHCRTDETGRLVPSLMFGHNHVAILSNDSKYGNLTHGSFVKGSPDGDTAVALPLNVNGAASGEHGGGVTLVLCSGSQPGLDGPAESFAVYMVRSGHKGNHFQTSLIKGDDKWKMTAAEDGTLQIAGVARSSYSLFHNRSANIAPVGEPETRSYLGQALNGAEQLCLLGMESVKSGTAVLLVLCSHSYGLEDSSVAALHCLSIQDGGRLQCHLVAESNGKNYCADTAGPWSFNVADQKLLVTGPKGRCRYGLISNLPCGPAGKYIVEQEQCLTSGLVPPLTGVVNVGEEQLVGWVSARHDVLIKKNEGTALLFSGAVLLEHGGKFAFHHEWSAEERSPGLHLIRAYGLVTDASSGERVEVELAGSPAQVAYQPRGVLYAVNAAGPAYEALNGIVYGSEFSQYANFSADYVNGTQMRCLGGEKTIADVPHIINGTYDCPLYVTNRTTGTEATDEQKLLYEVPTKFPRGDYILRIHTTSNTLKQVNCNGKDITSEISRHLAGQREVYPGLQALTADVPVKVTDGTLKLTVKSGHVTGFALLEAGYREARPSPRQTEDEAAEKQKLSDEVEHLSRAVTRKERKIVGWSPNLLQNASGEAGNMSHWNISGDWKVQDGGHGTEKAFVTSHMACVKYQEVNLMEHFSAEYLDTAPEIQVTEWYREGCCGGGFYKMEATLLNSDGKKIADFKYPMTDRIYRDSRWEQVKAVFKDYGQGARIVAIESYGKDDKCWGGHYGAIMSNAVIRLRRETKAADDDAFVDVLQGEDTDSYSKTREKLVAQVLADNKEILAELLDDNVLPDVDAKFVQQLEGIKVTKTKAKSRKKREIRVFVSSTFRDFKEEREQLIKKTFREVNAICADRGVFFTYVDLRWGITEEQTSHGQTIAICLQEIDRCRPYFICMMGERFGWSQTDDKPDKLLNESFTYAAENFPKAMKWVEQHRYGTSVTQLEILHGVLNDVTKNSDRSFFYIREALLPGSVSPNKYKTLSAESDWHRGKQEQLRKSILERDAVKTRQYNSPEQACDLIKADLEWCVDQDFPRGTELTALEREREAHAAFAEARRRVYIGGLDYFRQVDEYMAEHRKKPLVIVGQSGSGKSALVANWVGRLEEKEPETFVFVHFIGSSAESASYVKLIRRLLEEVRSHLGLSLAVPSSDAALQQELPVWLRLAGQQTRCVLVLDALNQLDDGSGEEGGEHDLHWVPRELPPGVHVLLSTLPGRALDAARAAGWTMLEVGPLDRAQKGHVITEYLEGIYGKTLSEEQKAMLVEAEQTTNALYLKALLDEVRVYGNFRTLSDKIRDYLSAGNPGDLFAKILERLEGDFQQGRHHCPGLVSRTTRAIWCSHRGMSEAELLDLLQVPSAVWSPFFLSLVENLVNRNGVVNFFHDHLRQAVESTYLPSVEDKTSSYRWLADFFQTRPMDDRKVDELPFLLAKAGQLDRLKETISDLEVFRRLVISEDGKFELTKAWKLLGDFSQAESCYLAALEAVPLSDRQTEAFSQLQQDMAEFFLHLGLYSSAQSLLEGLLPTLEERHKETHSCVIYSAINHSREYKCNHPTVVNLLHKLGLVCQKEKKLELARDYFSNAIGRQHRLTSPSKILQLAEGLLGQATVYYLMNDMVQSKKYMVRARDLATDVLGTRHHYVAAIINKLGQLCYRQGRLEEALGYFLQDLTLTRGEVGTSHPRVAGILNDIALVYDDRGETLAGRLYEAALGVLLETYGNNHVDVAVVRFNLGAFYLATCSFLRAKYQLTESVTVYESFLGGDHADTMETRTALEEASAFCV